MKDKDLKKFLLDEQNNINIPLSQKIIDVSIQKPLTIDESVNKKFSFKRLFPIFASVMCCLILIVSLCFYLIPINNNSTNELTSYILEINPSFCVTCDSNDKIVNVCALNNDADDILDNSEFDNLTNMNLSSCINYIINDIDENVFANYGDNRIKIYALNDNQTLTTEKLDQFGDIIHSSLDNRGFGNIEFDKQQMSIDNFKDIMGFSNEFNKLDDMRPFIEQHDKYYDKNHMPPPPPPTTNS
jgi:hypothetical protein